MIELDRFEISNIVQDNSVFSIYVDAVAKQLHILDLDEPNRRTVTNNASRDFLIRLNNFLISELGNNYGVQFMENILYGTDGVAAHFDIVDQDFKPVDPVRALYPPFDKILRDRYAEGIFQQGRLNRD